MSARGGKDINLGRSKHHKEQEGDKLEEKSGVQKEF